MYHLKIVAEIHFMLILNINILDYERRCPDNFRWVTCRLVKCLSCVNLPRLSNYLVIMLWRGMTMIEVNLETGVVRVFFRSHRPEGFSLNFLHDVDFAFFRRKLFSLASVFESIILHCFFYVLKHAFGSVFRWAVEIDWRDGPYSGAFHSWMSMVWLERRALRA